MSLALDSAGPAARPVSALGTLAALSLSMLLSSLGTSVANVALPSFAKAFDASFQEVQWVVLAYLLAVTTTIVGVGRLGDLVGRKRLLLGGISLFTIAAILCGVAPTLWLLVAARAVQGVGAAIMMALSMALIAEAVPAGRTGGAMGLLGSTSAMGTALGPSLGGLLIAAFGWGAIFLVAVPPGLLTFAVAYRHLPSSSADEGRASFDTVGTLLLGLTLAAYALAMTLGRGGFGPVNAALLAASLVGLVLFLLSQVRSSSPLISLATLARPGLAAGLILSLIVSTVLMATLVVGPFYLSRALGLETAAVGAVLSIGPLMVAFGGVPAGRAADRFGEQAMILVGLGVIGAGCLALSLLPAALGVLGYIPATVTLTLGYALFQAANNSAVMTGAGADQRGAVSGLLNLSRNLGLITGASLMGAVFAAAANTAHITTAPPETVAAAMRFTFAVAAALMLVALGLAALRIRTRSRLAS